MSNELIVREFNGIPQRIEIDEDSKEWWHAGDSCKSLGLENTAKAIKRVPKLHITQRKAYDQSGYKRKQLFVDEAGLNYLIAGSEKPEAKIYKEWIYSEVLPSIRKTGSYSIQPLSQLDIIQQSLDILKRHDAELSTIRTELDQYKETQQAITAVLAPVKETPTRIQLSKVVRGYAENHGKEYKECWGKLYSEFKDRYSIDLTIRAKNSGKSRLDIAEELGCMSDLFSLAVHLFVGGN